mmetsp:Transcript_91881/g.134279  ORF Transcript_91881/g.134279 Transcript_91881/m.134279 type:complete len:205 (+) Transcript_91881:490-1104(+)
MDFFPQKNMAPQASRMCITWGKGVMPRKPLSWNEWTKRVFSSEEKPPFRDWAKEAKERREKEEEVKRKENEEKNKLIADTKAALTAVKREKLAQAVEKKKADNAALLLQEAQQRCEALARLAAEAEQARQNAELVARLAANGTEHDDDEGLCVVCMECVGDHAFLPCGHRCVCKEDADALRLKPPLKCPLCREPAVSCVKIFSN